jgi:hypothetical protein
MDSNCKSACIRNCGTACKKSMEACLGYDKLHTCQDRLEECLSRCAGRTKIVIEQNHHAGHNARGRLFE